MKKYISLSLLLSLVICILTSCDSTSDTTVTQVSPTVENTEKIDTNTNEEVKSTDILLHQADIDSRLQAELHEGGYSFENPFTIVNPYGVSPLTALVLFETEQPAIISVEVLGLRGGESISHTFTDMITQHNIPIYGLYSEEETTVILTATFENNSTQVKELSIAGGELPGSLITGDVITADTQKMADGLTFVSIISPTNYAHAIDCNGDVRWVYSVAGGLSRTFPIKVLQNGNLLSNISEGTTSYYKYGLQEFDLTGKIYYEYMLDSTQHDAVELPNGNFLVLGDDISGNGVIEDTVYELDRKTGAIVRIFDMDSYFNVNDTGENIADEMHGSLVNDWFHSNSISYYEKDNSFIISGRNQDAIIKISMDSGELVWIFAPIENDTWNTYFKELLLTPIGDNFEYSYGQHNIQYMENGDLLLFDNGLYRGKTSDTIIPVEDGFSRLVRYSINEHDRTIEQVWEYGKNRGSEILSRFVSGVQYIEENHYLGHFGGIVRDEFGNPSYSYAAALDKASNHTYIIEVLDDNVVFEYHVNVNGENTDGNSYRSIRINPYTNTTQPTFDVGVRLGNLTKFDKVTISDFTPTNATTLENSITIEDTGITLTISNLPTDFDDLTLFLVGDTTYQSSIELLNYQLKLVSGEVPVGVYTLFVQVDDTLYELGYSWNNTSTTNPIPESFQIDVISNDYSMGEVFGSGKYYANTPLTVTAIAKDGFSFVGFEINGQIVSKEYMYSFIPTDDLKIIGVFE